MHSILYIPFSDPRKTIQEKKQKKVANCVFEDVQRSPGLVSSEKRNYFLFTLSSSRTSFTRCLPTIRALPPSSSLALAPNQRRNTLVRWGDFLFKSFSLLFKIFYNISKNISELLQKGGESANSLLKIIVGYVAIALLHS